MNKLFEDASAKNLPVSQRLYDLILYISHQILNSYKAYFAYQRFLLHLFSEDFMWFIDSQFLLIKFDIE